MSQKVAWHHRMRCTSFVFCGESPPSSVKLKGISPRHFPGSKSSAAVGSSIQQKFCSHTSHRAPGDANPQPSTEQRHRRTGCRCRGATMSHCLACSAPRGRPRQPSDAAWASRGIAHGGYIGSLQCFGTGACGCLRGVDFVLQLALAPAATTQRLVTLQTRLSSTAQPPVFALGLDAPKRGRARCIIVVLVAAFVRCRPPEEAVATTHSKQPVARGIEITTSLPRHTPPYRRSAHAASCPQCRHTPPRRHPRPCRTKRAGPRPIDGQALPDTLQRAATYSFDSVGSERL
jgi:hypothetical protein